MGSFVSVVDGSHSCVWYGFTVDGREWSFYGDMGGWLVTGSAPGSWGGVLLFRLGLFLVRCLGYLWRSDGQFFSCGWGLSGATFFG